MRLKSRQVITRLATKGALNANEELLSKASDNLGGRICNTGFAEDVFLSRLIFAAAVPALAHRLNP